jgi:hypothetical protein
MAGHGVFPWFGCYWLMDNGLNVLINGDTVGLDAKKVRTFRENVRTDSKKVRTFRENVRTNSKKVRTFRKNVRTDSKKVRTFRENVRTNSEKVRTFLEKVLMNPGNLPVSPPRAADAGGRYPATWGMKRVKTGGEIKESGQESYSA